jgi:uncharacterized membrane-anchored protein
VLFTFALGTAAGDLIAGASIGDYMSQAKADGGLGLGTTVTSLIFLATILVLVIYLQLTRKDATENAARREAAAVQRTPALEQG